MYLLTGTTGFLGPHILLELMMRGEKVKAMRRAASSPENLRYVFESKGKQEWLDKIDWVEGDVLDPLSLIEAMAGVKKVIHAAGFVSFDPRDRQKLFDINMQGTANMVNAAIVSGVEKFLYVSSVAALGGSSKEVIDEKTSWKDSPFNSVYGNSKYAGERETWRGMEEGMDVIVIEPSIFLGCGGVTKGGPGVYKAAKKGMRYYPAGTHGYINTADVAKASVLLMESDKVNEKYVLSAENLTHRELLGSIAQLCGSRVPDTEVKSWMLGLAWRWERSMSIFFNKKPVITRELANTMQQKMLFSGSKILSIGGFAYTPIDETLKELVEACKQH